jgi:hypothetical protein
MDWQALGYVRDPLARPVLEHEAIPLLDADGDMVHESGRPLSTAMTCSQCHDIEEDDFLATHAYHSTVVSGELNPERRALMEQGPRLPRDDDQQMNCFLCHLEQPAITEWQRAKLSDVSEWAVAATLVGTGVIEPSDGGYRWNKESLDEDDFVPLPMVYSRPQHCGNCHGLVHSDAQPLLLQLGSDDNWRTETTGQVFSAQRIRQSALNLQDKDRLNRAWDLHAQRLVACGDCHYTKTVPTRLIGEAGESNVTHAGTGPRECTSCHVDGQGHEWLPEQDRHFAAVTCEACHAPRIHLPARQQVDASVLTAGGDYLVSYRGLPQGGPDDLPRAFSVGYRPLLMRRRDAKGFGKWTPYNLVSRWYWIDGSTGEEVDRERLHRAWFDEGRYRPRIIGVFDVDRNGELDRTELPLDRDDEIELIRSLLTEQGVAQPKLEAEVRGYPIHHGIALDDADRSCARCHEKGPDPGFVLADHVPGGVLPSVFRGVSGSIRDRWQLGANGMLTIGRPSALSEAKVIPQEDN